MLKFKIDKKTYEALSDEMKAEYEAGDKSGEFVLSVEGLPEADDPAPFIRARDAEKAKHALTKKELAELKAKLDEVPDVEALKADHEKEVGKYKAFTEKSLKDGVAATLAAKISTAPALMKPHLLSRITVDMTGDEPKTVFLGPDGKPDPNYTAEKLSEEFVANADYKAIIIGSKASGGGAPKPAIKPQGGGAPLDGEQNSGEKPDLSKMNPTDFAARIAARKEAEASAAT